jgi:hypothetical protein
MKRIIAAVSFAVLSAPVLAAEVGAPYEKTQFDRGISNVEQKAERDASAGNTRAQDSVWANDYNFIAPPQ